MKFTLKKVDKFGWKGVNGLSIEIRENYSVSYIGIAVEIPRRKNTVNDRVYFIVEVKGKFSVGKKHMVLKKGEAAFIPKNTVYSYKPVGKVKLVEINEPPFSQEGEVIY